MKDSQAALDALMRKRLGSGVDGPSTRPVAHDKRLATPLDDF